MTSTIFSNSGLKFYMLISECICNRIMMKKIYQFFDPFTGEAPVKAGACFRRPKFTGFWEAFFEREINNLTKIFYNENNESLSWGSKCFSDSLRRYVFEIFVSRYSNDRKCEKKCFNKIFGNLRQGPALESRNSPGFAKRFWKGNKLLN